MFTLELAKKLKKDSLARLKRSGLSDEGREVFSQMYRVACRLEDYLTPAPAESKMRGFECTRGKPCKLTEGN